MVMVTAHGLHEAPNNHKIDENALGNVEFFMALRRKLDGKGNYHDIGLMDAINDTLQDLGIIDSKSTFYKQ